MFKLPKKDKTFFLTACTELFGLFLRRDQGWRCRCQFANLKALEFCAQIAGQKIIAQTQILIKKTNIFIVQILRNQVRKKRKKNGDTRVKFEVTLQSSRWSCSNDIGRRYTRRKRRRKLGDNYYNPQFTQHLISSQAADHRTTSHHNHKLSELVNADI